MIQLQDKVISLCHSKDCNRDVTLEFVTQAFIHLDLCKYPLYITTENESIGVGTNIKTGDGLWSERLRKAIEQIDCKHIIFFLEDMIIKNINSELFDEVIKYHVDNGHDLTKFGNHPFFNVIDTGRRVGDKKVLRQHNMPYILSHQPVSIWKKEFLLKVIEDDVTPWDHECITGQELYEGKFGEYKVYVIGSYPAINAPVGTDYGEIIEYHHLLTRGQKIEYKGRH